MRQGNSNLVTQFVHAVDHASPPNLRFESTNGMAKFSAGLPNHRTFIHFAKTEAGVILP